MNPLRFRAWHDGTIYEKGWHVVTLDELIEYVGIEYSIPQNVAAFSCSEGTSHRSASTGLTDKNGKEIFEGDLLKAEIPERRSVEQYWNGIEVAETITTLTVGKSIIGEVRVNPKSGARMLIRRCEEKAPEMKLAKEMIDVRPTRYLRIKKNDVVIGNIYENSDLLRQAA